MNHKVWNVKNITVVLVVIVIALIQTPVALANDGVLGITPEGVYPITQSDIMMAAEEIHIQLLDHAKAKVTCRFDFKNFGEAQTVLMGFPAELDETGELSPPEAFWVHHFTARDEDGDLTVNLVDTIPNPPLKVNKLEKYSKWYSFSVDFDTNETKTLYHTYDISFPYNSMGNVSMGYVLETGALWKGPLGHSKIIFDFGDIPLYTLEEVYPNNFFTIEGNQLIWERSHFKPVHNLWVTRNASRYSEEWIKMYEESGATDEIQRINEKIELFNTPPETIQKNKEQYYQNYRTLLEEDPIRALYIKSALGLPHGNEKPEIIECSIRKQSGNTWYFDIYGTDPDGDLTSCKAVIDGISTYQYSDGNWRGQLYYNHEKKQFQSTGYLVTDEKEPFSVTFIMSDAYGNFDTKTLMIQNAPPEPSPTPIPAASPEAHRDKESADDPNTLPVSQTLQETEPDISPKANVFHMEEETIPILVTGVIIILLFCIAAVIYLYVKWKKNGYVLFILQFIFLTLAFIRVTGILTLKMENTTMLSENISLAIGISAVLWALSMVCMIIGLVVVGRNKKSERD